jgi:FixJ family two-component response regulator
MVQSPPAPRVVLVEDDDAVREALTFALEIDGFAVTGCPSGEALLALDLPSGPFCIVCDEHLPGISGMEALVRLRFKRRDLCAVLVTSYPSPELRRTAERHGVGIVEKPLLGDVLVAAIRTALESRP